MFLLCECACCECVHARVCAYVYTHAHAHAHHHCMLPHICMHMNSARGWWKNDFHMLPLMLLEALPSR